jgi:pilus assembly protein CpaB
MARSIAGAAQGRSNRRFLVIAVLLGALAAALAYAAVSRPSGGGDSGPSAGTTQVVVAKSAIKQRTTITAEMLELKNVPTNNVITGAFTSLDDAVGKITKFPVEANQQIVTASVVDLQTRTNAEALSLVVPSGQRGVAINTDQVVNAGGLILPGDYVDVVWICCDQKVALARSILQNVQVAAVAQGIGDSGPAGDDGAPAAVDTGEAQPDASTVTLLLTPEQSRIVAMADLSGDLRLTVRAPGDGSLEVPADDFATALDLLPLELLQPLPKGLWPDGYKDQQ